MLGQFFVSQSTLFIIYFKNVLINSCSGIFVSRGVVDIFRLGQMLVK